MEDEDFMEAVEAENAIVEEVAEVEEPEQPEVEEQVVEEAEPEAVEPPEPTHERVPISAMLDERDKRKALEQELAQLRASQQQPETSVPDMYDDPEGYQAYTSNQIAQSTINVKLDLSEDLARTAHGDETVDAARDWAIKRFQQNPGYQAQVFSERNPYGYIVKEYQKAQIADSVTPDDYEQFKAWKAAQSQTAPTPVKAPPPPRSLASAPSAGGIATEIEPTDEEVFNDVFPRK